MLIAVDTLAETVVTGPAASQSRSPDASRSYQCLFCETPLNHTGATDSDPLAHFEHANGVDCLHNEGASSTHRLGEELISRQLCVWLDRWFAVSPQEIQIAAEKHVGTSSNWVVADIRVSHPVQIVVEVVYLSSALNLRERLKRVFNQNYNGMVVVVADRNVSPTRIERHLTQVGSIHVGRIDPDRLEATVGSVVTPETVDLSPSAWSSVPEYLA